MTKKHETPQHGTWAEYVKRGCRCAECKEAARLYNKQRREKDPSITKRDNVYSRQWAKDNPDKRKSAETKWREQNPDKHREDSKRRSEKFRMKLYALAPERHAEMLAAQGGVCAVCGSPDNRQLSVDHDHETGAVRGLLCRRCNLGMGCFADDPKVLERAIQYLHSSIDAATL